MENIAEFLVYDLKVAALLTVFYMFYRLLLERESFFRLNRVVLIIVAMLSAILPLCQITLHETVKAMATISADGQQASLSHLGAAPTASAVSETTASEWFLQYIAPWLGILILAGIIFRLAYTIRGIINLRKLIRRCEQHTLNDGIRVAVSEEPLAPCSWMNTIVMSRADFGDGISPQTSQAIIAHERAHIRCGHSRDVLLMELLIALQWWNPVVWFLRQDLRALHEYEADAGVVSHGFDTKQYIQLLMQKASGVQVCALANGIKSNKTKSRILMMLRQNKSPMSRRLRVLYILPIAAISLAMTAKTVYTYQVVEKKTAGSQKQSTRSGIPTVMIGGQETTWDKAEAKAREMGIDTSANQLCVVDGRVISFEEFENLSLSKEEIDYVNVLGPESATKLYGEKGAKGAVIIKTKAKSQEEEPVFTVCEEMPKFKGGEAELMKLLAQNMKYPAVAVENGVQGRVLVRFVVEKDGSISNDEIASIDHTKLEDLKTQNAAAKAMQDEARRVVRLTSGKWNPAKQSGKIVRCEFTLPITYRLQ